MQTNVFYCACCGDFLLIKISSISGEQDATYIINPLMEEHDLVIDIQHLSPGLYFLAIGTKTEKTVMKLIVQ